MSVAPGVRIGVYEIGELLGAGGMGQVFRARDTRLGRQVAIKVLPATIAWDDERRARVEREARVLASLNHPNIATLHGVEESPHGTALVMELVEGETLAERISLGTHGRPGLPLRETLAIAAQVSAALDAAHEHGIVHRDLKPANIVVRPDGTVKVLDFGLAKALEPVGGTVADAVTLTEESPGMAGPGTPAYMSPEQVRGLPVDKRTDVWAFGCVLYELLTGRRPFGGDHTSDVMARILEREPDFAALPRDTPASVQRLLHRCLEKNPQDRMRDMGDVRLELLDALSPSTADRSSAPVDSVSQTDAGTRRRRRAAAILAGTFVVGMVVGALLLSRRPTSSPVVRSIIAADTFISGTDRGFAFTRDGSALAYIGKDARQMFVRPLNSLEPTAILTTAAYIRGVFPSPDGRWFAYIENNFGLKKVSAAGGTPLTLLTMDGPSRGAAWGPDDTIVFATGASSTGLQRVSATGGPVTVLTRPDHERGEADHVNPVWLPDGRTLLFTIVAAQGGLDAAKVAALDLATGVWRTVLEGGYGARYVDSGHLVYGANGALWATRFDLNRLETQGAAREVLRPVSTGGLGAVSEIDIASNGMLAYSRGASQDRRIPAWVDRTGRETPLAVPPGNYTHPRLSPDGKRLAIVASGDIFMWDFARPWSTASRLTFDPRIDWYPVWAPDSRRILFGSWRGGAFSNIYSYDLEAGTTERLTDSPDMQLPTAITADGATLIFHNFGRSVQALPLRGGTPPVTLVDTSMDERNGEISPDGRWLAYEGESPTRPGELDVYVRSFPDVDRGLWQVTRGGGLYPVWSRNGRELFYVTFDGAMFAVPVEASQATWRAGSATQLFRGQYDLREGSLGRTWDASPDGRFLMLKNSSADTPDVVLVQNWVAEIARQVP